MEEEEENEEEESLPFLRRQSTAVASNTETAVLLFWGRTLWIVYTYVMSLPSRDDIETNIIEELGNSYVNP